MLFTIESQTVGKDNASLTEEEAARWLRAKGMR